MGVGTAKSKVAVFVDVVVLIVLRVRVPECSSTSCGVPEPPDHLRTSYWRPFVLHY